MVETASLPELKLRPEFRADAEVKFMNTLAQPKKVKATKTFSSLYLVNLENVLTIILWLIHHARARSSSDFIFNYVLFTMLNTTCINMTFISSSGNWS